MRNLLTPLDPNTATACERTALVSRASLGDEYLAIADVGAAHAGREPLPLELYPGRVVIGWLIDELSGGVEVFRLAEAPPSGIQFAGRFLAAAGEAKLRRAGSTVELTADMRLLDAAAETAGRAWRMRGHHIAWRGELLPP
jgi:hypothetical protein